MYLPLRPRAKGPLTDSYERITDDPLEVEKWFREGLNVGRTLEGQTALDFDKIEAARRFWKEHNDLCVLVNLTFHGIHALFSGETKQGPIIENGEKVGDRKSGKHSYIVWPKSKVWQEKERVLHEYRLIRGHEGITLPPFPESLFPIISSTRKEVQRIESDTLRRITRARNWLAKAEPAVSGQHGHDKLFFCCCRMFQVFDLTLEQAFPLILEYNSKCQPPFSERDVLHKLQDANTSAVSR